MPNVFLQKVKRERENSSADQSLLLLTFHSLPSHHSVLFFPFFPSLLSHSGLYHTFQIGFPFPFSSSPCLFSFPSILLYNLKKKKKKEHLIYFSLPFPTPLMSLFYSCKSHCSPFFGDLPQPSSLADNLLGSPGVLACIPTFFGLKAGETANPQEPKLIWAGDVVSKSAEH